MSHRNLRSSQKISTSAKANDQSMPACVAQQQKSSSRGALRERYEKVGYQNRIPSSDLMLGKLELKQQHLNGQQRSKQHTLNSVASSPAIASTATHNNRRSPKIKGATTEGIKTNANARMTLTPTPPHATMSSPSVPSGSSQEHNGSQSPTSGKATDPEWERHTQMLQNSIDANSVIINVDDARTAIIYFAQNANEISLRFLEMSRLGGTMNKLRKVNSGNAELAPLIDQCRKVVRTWSQKLAASKEKAFAPVTKTGGTVSSPMHPPASPALARTSTTPGQLSSLHHKPVTPIDRFRLQHGIQSPQLQQLPVVAESSRSPSPAWNLGTSSQSSRPNSAQGQNQPAGTLLQDSTLRSPPLKMRLVRTADGKFSSSTEKDLDPAKLKRQRESDSESPPPLLENMTQAPQEQPTPAKKLRYQNEKMGSAPPQSSNIRYSHCQSKSNTVSPQVTIGSNPTTPSTVGALGSRRQTAKSTLDLLADLNAELPDSMKVQVTTPTTTCLPVTTLSTIAISTHSLSATIAEPKRIRGNTSSKTASPQSIESMLLKHKQAKQAITSSRPASRPASRPSSRGPTSNQKAAHFYISELSHSPLPQSNAKRKIEHTEPSPSLIKPFVRNWYKDLPKVEASTLEPEDLFGSQSVLDASSTKLLDVDDVRIQDHNLARQCSRFIHDFKRENRAPVLGMPFIVVPRSPFHDLFASKLQINEGLTKDANEKTNQKIDDMQARFLMHMSEKNWRYRQPPQTLKECRQFAQGFSPMLGKYSDEDDDPEQS